MEPIAPIWGIDPDSLDPAEFEFENAVAEASSLEELRAIQEGKVAKRLSPAFGSRQRRRAQLVARLKQSRRYGKPVRGGTGKQSRSRRRSF